MIPQDHPMADSSSPESSTPKPSSSSSSTSQPKEGWEITLEQLRRTNEELQRRKLDAEKDKELFRELYNKASSHVSEVAKENNSLHDRVDRLETQLQEGLVMIRGTYESQIKHLEDEVERWKGLYGILQVKDIKTNGDDIRRKAACEGELRRENQRLKEQLEMLREDYENMETAFEQLGEKELQSLDEQEQEFKSSFERTTKNPGVSGATPGVAVQFGRGMHPAVPVS